MKKTINWPHMFAIILSKSGCVGGEAPKQENLFPYATQDIKKELAKKLFNKELSLGVLTEEDISREDYWEIINYVNLFPTIYSTIYSNMGNELAVLGETQEQQFFWYYLVRLRTLTLYRTLHPGDDNAPGYPVINHLDMLESATHDFAAKNPEKAQEILASVIAYEEQHPYNPQKGLEEGKNKVKNMTREQAAKAFMEPLEEVNKLSDEEFKKALQDAADAQKDVPAEFPNVRNEVLQSFKNLLDEMKNKKPEDAPTADNNNSQQAKNESTQPQDNSFPYATKEIKQELAKRFFGIEGDIAEDFFETVNYAPIMQAMIQAGPAIFGGKEEQQVFWYYVMRLRMLTIYFTFPRAVDDPGFLVEQLNMLSGPARKFIDEHPQEGQTIFASIIDYEEKHPYNPQKGIDEQKNKIKNMTREEAANAYGVSLDKLNTASDEQFKQQLQEAADEINDIPAEFQNVREKILQAFRNDLEQIKSGLSPEEYAAKRKAELGIMEYELALTMHPLYPIEPFFSVLYLDQQEDQAAELPMQPDTGWTYKFPSHIRGQEGPLPCKLDMVYYSVVEHKCYSIQAPLPTDKLKELFAQKNADGDPLYTDITVGAAPYGKVVLWVQRNDTYEVQLVTQVQGEETEVSYEDFSRGFHTVGGNNWDEFHENILKQYPQAAENLTKNGLPDRNLFDQFNEKYNTKISIIFKESPKEGVPVNDVKISSVKVSYFNGETENLPEGQNESRLRAKVKSIEIHFQDGQNENSAYLYVPYQTSLDNKDIQQVYNNIFGEDHNQPGQLTFAFNGPSKPWTITLAVGEKQEEIPMEEIRFRNKFEDYRTPVYYQPESQWKGQKPKEESPEIVINTATMNELNSNGETPLIDAVRSQKNDLVTKLLEAGADVNIVASGTGETALSAASAMGHTEHVKQLIAAGANVNQPEGQSGMTPLMVASRSGNTEIIKLLIDAGADVNAKQYVNGLDAGYNALKYARENSHEEIVQLLINHGAQEIVVQQQTAAAAPMTNSLDQALMAGNVDKVKEFLANGANPNTLIPGVGPALLFACTLGNAEIVQALVDAKADINSVSSTTGFTPLMMAAQLGNKAIVEVLIKAGADVNIQHQMNGQPSGLNALKIAQNGGFTEIADVLKAAGATE